MGFGKNLTYRSKPTDRNNILKPKVLFRAKVLLLNKRYKKRKNLLETFQNFYAFLHQFVVYKKIHQFVYKL